MSLSLVDIVIMYTGPRKSNLDLPTFDPQHMSRSKHNLQVELISANPGGGNRGNAVTASHTPDGARAGKSDGRECQLACARP